MHDKTTSEDDRFEHRAIRVSVHFIEVRRAVMCLREPAPLFLSERVKTVECIGERCRHPVVAGRDPDL
jgi:hypothetical protein